MKTSLIERRVGTKEKAPKRVALKAGPLTVDFVAGNLRAIRYEGHEVLRAIAYVVRNADWGTFSPEISDCKIRKSAQSFTVTYRARCVSADSSQVLDYQASISGNAQGNLAFQVLARPLTPFRTARCGFAVLHPIDGCRRATGHRGACRRITGADKFPRPHYARPAVQGYSRHPAPGHSVHHGALLHEWGRV